MNTKHKISVSCLALVFITINCLNGQDLKKDKYFLLRKTMVEQQIKERGIHNTKVLGALMDVPRHKFVRDEYKNSSYDDRPLPIGYNQTISQPYIVAYM